MTGTETAMWRVIGEGLAVIYARFVVSSAAALIAFIFALVKQ